MTMTMHKTREDESRKREWKEPNELDVPESLVRRLKSEGFGTRWIRISAEGKPDPVNVMTRLREGYEFVKREDAPEWEGAPSLEYGSHGNLIVIGDLALAKLPLDISQSRTRQINERTQSLTDAIQRQLAENRNLNRALPVSNRGSSSKVYSGGRTPTLD
jgi:hypothetical protein